MARVSPLYKAEPVIVIHLATDDSDEGQVLAACSGEVFSPDTSNYKNIPRVLCSGCLNAAKKGQ